MQQTNEQYEQEHELAVSVKTQQKAALYGIASVLVGTGMVPNKKGMKKNVKRLRREVLADIGPYGGEELLMQNKGAINMQIVGIRKDPKHSKDARQKLLRTVVDHFHDAYLKGVKNLGWQTAKGI